MFPPSRIVCLTEETVETLYLLGEEHRIVGVSGYAVRPPQVRREKPRVSAFISADFEKIIALKPDLVLTFSDLQADIAAELIRRNIAVHAFNQRDVAGIFDDDPHARRAGRRDREGRGARGVAGGPARCGARAGGALPRRPRVYFEEWDEPMISGIQWVSELIEAAGGIEVFPEARRRTRTPRTASYRLTDVIAAAPDIIIGSWCGKKFVPAKVAARPGFAAIPAVRDGALHEIKSALILQPGPAALTDGLDQLVRIVGDWAQPRQQRREIVERLDQRSAAANRVTWRQHDAPLRRIERIERRVAQIVAALVGTRAAGCSARWRPGAASGAFRAARSRRSPAARREAA